MRLPILHSFCWYRTCVLILTVCCCHSQVNAATSQEDDVTLAKGHVIGRVWHAKVRPAQIFELMQSIGKEIGQTSPNGVNVMISPPGFGRAMGPGSGLRVPGQTEPEIKGTLLVLQTLPEPNLNHQIGFESIGDLDAFTKRVKESASQMGPAAEVIGKDDRYEVKLNFSRLISALPGPPAIAGTAGEGPPTVRTFSIVVQADVGGGPGNANSTAAAPPKMPTSISTFYRYSDGMLFSCDSDMLHTIDLPSAASLQLPDDGAAHHIHADCDLSSIPAPLKMAFWNSVEASASTLLQKLDDEADADYSLRRAIGAGRLELVKTALFDIDRIRLSLDFSDDGIQPVLANLRVTARENSQLAKSLDVLGSRPSRLAGIADKSTPLVISSTIELPEWSRPLAIAFVESMRLQLHAAANDDALRVLVDDLITPIQQSVQDGLIDSAVAMQGVPSTGMTVVGAVRLKDAERFVGSMESLLLIKSDESRLQVSRSQIGDYSAVTLISDGAALPGTQKAVPVQVNVCAIGSWAWFTIGAEQSLTVLEKLVAESETRLAQSSAGMPLLVRLRLDQWLGETDDPFSQVPRELLESLERRISVATRPRFSIRMNGQPQPAQVNNFDDQFDSFASRLLTPENAEFEFKVVCSGRELTADAAVGMGVIRFMLAQYVVSQNRMFQHIQFALPDGALQAVPRGIRISR